MLTFFTLSLIGGLCLAEDADKNTKKHGEREHETPILLPVNQRQIWHQKLHWQTGQCPLRSPFANDGGIASYTLKGGNTLIVVACSLGVYQGDSLLYAGDEKHGYGLLAFRQFRAYGNRKLVSYTDALLRGIVMVQPSQNSVEVLRKYRGLGDCGQLLRYRIEGGQAKLDELRIKECDEVPGGVPPKAWRKVTLPREMP